MHLLWIPLLVVGFAVGVSFYVLVGLWAIRAVAGLWGAVAASVQEHRDRADAAQQRRRLADVQRLEPRRRAPDTLRRVA